MTRVYKIGSVRVDPLGGEPVLGYGNAFNYNALISFFNGVPFSSNRPEKGAELFTV